MCDISDLEESLLKFIMSSNAQGHDEVSAVW